MSDLGLFRDEEILGEIRRSRGGLDEWRADAASGEALSEEWRPLLDSLPLVLRHWRNLKVECRRMRRPIAPRGRLRWGVETLSACWVMWTAMPALRAKAGILLLGGLLLLLHAIRVTLIALFAVESVWALWLFAQLIFWSVKLLWLHVAG